MSITLKGTVYTRVIHGRASLAVVRGLVPGYIIVTAGSGGDCSMVAVEIVAAENLTKGDPVTSTGYKANSANTGHRGKVLGVAAEDIAINTSGSVVVDGELEYVGYTFSAGDTLYLNSTAISATPPVIGFSQEMGTAIENDKVVIELKNAILI